jgi:hypothetical protein
MEQALNKMQVEMYNNPQLTAIVEALKGNPQLMQAVQGIVQQQGNAQGQPQKPQGGAIKPQLGPTKGQAATGQVAQPPQPMVAR